MRHAYDPDQDPTLKDVNTEVCEQTNALLKTFQATVRQMTVYRSKIFMLYMCHLKNLHFEKTCGRSY